MLQPPPPQRLYVSGRLTDFGPDASLLNSHLAFFPSADPVPDASRVIADIISLAPLTDMGGGQFGSLTQGRARSGLDGDMTSLVLGQHLCLEANVVVRVCKLFPDSLLAKTVLAATAEARDFLPEGSTISEPYIVLYLKRYRHLFGKCRWWREPTWPEPTNQGQRQTLTPHPPALHQFQSSTTTPPSERPARWETTTVAWRCSTR
jgi:hypothetical protein